MSKASPHFAKSLYFTCIDERLFDNKSAYIDQLGGAFHPAMAGGGHAIVNPEHRASAIMQIVIGYKVNHITDVYLESHTDCGAYGLSGITFSDPTEEINHLYRDLDTASELVKNALHEAGAKPGEVTIH